MTDSLQEKRRLLNQVDSLELALEIKADEVKELKAKLEAEVKGRLEDQHQHEQVSDVCCLSGDKLNYSHRMAWFLCKSSKSLSYLFNFLKFHVYKVPSILVTISGDLLGRFLGIIMIITSNFTS